MSANNNETYIVTGTLTDDHTVKLDQALPVGMTRTPIKVRLVVKPLRIAAQRPYLEVMAEIRQRQQAYGHRPPTRTEVDNYLLAEHDSWEE